MVNNIKVDETGSVIRLASKPLVTEEEMFKKRLRERINERIVWEQTYGLPKLESGYNENPRRTDAHVALEWVLAEMEKVA